jgi:NhaP-type Na+/H+ and K+/H+ antiporter
MHYHQHTSTRILYALFGAPLVLGTIAMSLTLPWAGLQQKQAIFNIVFLLLLLWGGVWLVASALRFRLTVTAQAVTLRRAFTTRTIARSDIAFYRKLRVSQGDPALFIFVRGKKLPGLRIACVFKDDDAVIAWLDARHSSDVSG